MTGQGRFFDAAGRAGVMGLHIVSGIVVGGMIGYGIDAMFGCRPWGLLIFLLFGIVAGFRNMWHDAKIMMRFTSDERTGLKDRHDGGSR